MATPSINLKTLEFNEIKTELINYLRSNSDFSDYDFEGSALSTIVDLLTYNTFYQLIFQNILVNEMFIDSAQKLESLISHAKIQGYVVPGKRSSTATLRVTNSAGGTIPAYTRFQGIKNNSEVRYFYNLEEKTLVSNGTNLEAVFDVYEAKRFVKGSPFPFSADTQSVFIPETDVDFRTIKVSVNSGDGFVDYTVATSAEPTISQNTNVCFIERRQSGYDVIFTGTYDSDNGVFTTSNLPDSTIVQLTYAVPSGSIANGCSAFSFAGANPITSPTITTTRGSSSNGTDQPSIENLKFNIPRIYSAQSRVVTKDDVKAFLIENGFATSFSEISVEGGEERGDEFLGKVFFRVSPDLSADNQSLAESLLGEKSISGISYLYDETLGSGT